MLLPFDDVDADASLALTTVSLSLTLLGKDEGEGDVLVFSWWFSWSLAGGLAGENLPESRAAFSARACPPMDARLR
jgi:hypothetical protein